MRICTIRKVGDKWCLFTKDGKQKLGCHETREDAVKQERAIYVRRANAKAEGYTAREEELNGRAYLVVPVVALVEGVVHAMNAESPELVSLEEYSKAALGFNHKPLFYGHPMRGGQPVFGADPSIVEEESIGLVFNAEIRDAKLMMEAWIDVERAPSELLARARAGKDIEISVGVAAETLSQTGKFGGEDYDGKWTNIMPDHLALLPPEHTGACSIEMGCGVRAAAKGEDDVSEKKSLLARVMGALRAALPASEMSDNDVRRKLFELVSKEDPTVSYVEAVYDNTFVYCVYNTANGDYQSVTYRRDYSLAKNGTVSLGEDKVEVEPQLIYEPKPKPKAAEATPEPTNAEASAPCSCHKKEALNNQENKTMAVNKDRVSNLITKLPALFTSADEAFLTGASEELVARFEASIPKEQPVAAETKAETKVEAAVEAPKTVDEVIAGAPEALRAELGEGVKAARAKKTASIATLKASGRCEISDKDLEAKSQAELDQLVKLAGEVKAAVDFSGQGTPRPKDETPAVPAAPDFVAEMKAASEARNAGKR